MRCSAAYQYSRPNTRLRGPVAKPKDQTPVMSSTSSPPPTLTSLSKVTRSSTANTVDKDHSISRPTSLITRSQGVAGPRPSKVQASRPHGGRHLQPPTGDNAKLKHKCPFDGCSWRFATPYKLRRHIKSHTKETPFQCTECGRGFSVRYNLLMHVQTIHSVPQKYQCPVKGCKEAFHTQPRLNGHLRRVHKKDWKQLHLSQSVNSDTDSQGGSPCSTDSQDPAQKASQSESQSSGQRWFSCGVCHREFSSQAKLSAHMRVHSRDKPYKCNVEGCSKTFNSSDKLSRHLATHKGSQPLCCPHKNCSRVFARQSHLKNHLKVHNSNDLVTDCDVKCSTEALYNDHYQYQLLCPHPDCQLTFPTQKRLELHVAVAHDPSCHTGIKINSPSPSTAGSPSLIPMPQSTHDLAAPRHDDLCYSATQNENLENFELPDLKVEDIEAVISDQSDWSGEQMENFFRSLDMNQVDCGQSLGGSGYESDSGYSTYDVSPVDSNMSIRGHYSSSLSPAITPVTPTPILSSSSPLPITSFHEDYIQSAVMLSTPLAVTPQSATDGYLDLPSLPPHSAAAESFPEHMYAPHFQGLYQMSECVTTCPVPASPSLASLQGFALSMGYTSPYTLSSEVPQCTPPVTCNTTTIEDDKHTVVLIPNTYTCTGHIPQAITPTPSSPLLLQSLQLPTKTQVQQKTPVSLTVGSEPLHHPPSSPAYSSTTSPAFVASSENDMKLKDAEDPLLTGSPPPLVSIVDATLSDTRTSVKPLPQKCPTDHTVYAQVLPPTSTISAHSLTPSPEQQAPSPQCKGSRGTRMKGRQVRSGSVPTKRLKRTKSQWPKSMNPGNLMAFRNFILNKLKKGQEKPLTVTGVPQPLSHSLHRSYSETGSAGDKSGESSPSAMSSHDLMNDMSFDPDTLLSCTMSLDAVPFDLLNQSTTPDDAFSVSSPDSQIFGSETGVDFDGYAQLFSTDDLPLSEALSDSNISTMDSDLDNIFKTDYDPLLGAMS